MGGLVARRYLACEGGAERCSLLVTLGTPYRGAAKAIGAIAHGIAKVPGRTGERLHGLLRSLPSVHELLPTYDCLLGHDGRRVALGDRLPGPSPRPGCSMPPPRSTPGHKGPSGPWGQRCRPPSPSPASTGPPPPWPASGPTVTSRCSSTPRTPAGSHRSRGDGTVPRASAQPPEWGDDPTRAHVVTGRHVDLPAHVALHQVIAAALEGRRYLGLGLGPGTDEGLAVDIPELAAGGEAVLVSARHPDDRLELEVRVTDAHDGTGRGHAALANRGGGHYDQVLGGVGARHLPGGRVRAGRRPTPARQRDAHGPARHQVGRVSRHRPVVRACGSGVQEYRASHFTWSFGAPG